jgi:hypothetical protein
MTADEYRAAHPGAQIMALPVAFEDSSGEVVAAIEEGAAESKNGRRCATLYLPFGDVAGFRNLQSGEIGSLNLDYGAGSAQDRGIVSRNIDIGRGADHYDGRGRLIYRERGYDDEARNFAQFHAPLRLDKPYLLVKNGTGWRKHLL